MADAPRSRPPSVDAARPAPDAAAADRTRAWSPALVLVGLVVVVALVSFVWTPYAPTRVDPPSRLLGPSAEHWLGTDKFGRDVVSHDHGRCPDDAVRRRDRGRHRRGRRRAARRPGRIGPALAVGS